MASNELEAEILDPNRKLVLQKLKTHLHPHTLKPVAWALLQIADLECVKELNTRAELDGKLVVGYLDSLQSPEDIVKKWCQSPSATTTKYELEEVLSPATIASLASESSTKSKGRGQKRDSTGKRVNRNKKASNLAKERDGGSCVLTKQAGSIEGAHIFPFCMRREDRHTTTGGLNFWEILSRFWPQNKVDEWHDAIFGEDGTEVCANIITMSKNAHAFWAEGRFALKPLQLSEDKKELEVQFFWMRHTTRVYRHDLLEKAELIGADDQGPDKTMLLNVDTKQVIKSGDIIVLKTKDSENLPLPSFAILELQWHLNRVVAMTGGADVDEDVESFSDDDEEMSEVSPVPLLPNAQ